MDCQETFAIEMSVVMLCDLNCHWKYLKRFERPERMRRRYAGDGRPQNGGRCHSLAVYRAKYLSWS